MIRQQRERKRAHKSECPTANAGSSCPCCAGWDQSPAAEQKRAAELRATIPTEVAAQVQGLFVAEFGLCIAKFVAKTVKPRKRFQLDEAVFRLANGSPLGMLCAFIEFENGSKIRFEVMHFKDFTPAPTERGTKASDVDRDRNEIICRATELVAAGNTQAALDCLRQGMHEGSLATSRDLVQAGCLLMCNTVSAEFMDKAMQLVRDLTAAGVRVAVAGLPLGYPDIQLAAECWMGAEGDVATAILWLREVENMIDRCHGNLPPCVDETEKVSPYLKLADAIGRIAQDKPWVARVRRKERTRKRGLGAHPPGQEKAITTVSSGGSHD